MRNKRFEHDLEKSFFGEAWFKNIIENFAPLANVLILFHVLLQIHIIRQL